MLNTQSCCCHNGSTCCGVFKGGIQNQKKFWLKINYNSRLRSRRGLLLRQKVFYFFSPQLVRDLTKILALMQNHGLVHYFTLDFIPCVLSWTMDSGPLLYTSFFFSTLKNLMQNHGPTRTKKSCPIEQDIVLTGSMIVHEISMQQCTSEESWTHK